ncbi:MAG: hypothetical protein RLZZ78_666 [Armatimonadota bacterium]
MKHAVVTGGSGFLGSHLSKRLLSEGYKVTVFTLIEHDVIQPFTVDGPVDVVFHLASPASPVDFPTKPIEILQVNSVGTHNALELARIKGARFLIASTSEVYGDPLVHPQPETYIGIRGVYDESKRFGESITMAYRRFKGVDARIFRIFNTYGPNMRLDDGRVVPNFIGQALRGEPITVYGTGQQTRSFCYVRDLIDGIFRFSELDGDHSGPINLGNPTERTMLEFAQEIKRLTNSSSEIVYQELPTSDDPKQRRPDLTVAKALLNWEPVVSLEDGLLETIAYFKGKVGGSH